jgi:hypothetical protein
MAYVVIFKISVFLKKRLVSICEYILLSTYERKTAFSVIYKPKRARNRPFLRRFHLFRAALKIYLASVIPSTTTPLDRALPPPIAIAPSSSGVPRGL